MGLYDNVKAACEKSGISIMKLEEKLGFARSSICKWDTNCTSVARIQLVADELGTTVNDLIDDVTFKKKEMPDKEGVVQ